MQTLADPERILDAVTNALDTQRVEWLDLTQPVVVGEMARALTSLAMGTAAWARYETLIAALRQHAGDAQTDGGVRLVTAFDIEVNALVWGAAEWAGRVVTVLLATRPTAQAPTDTGAWLAGSIDAAGPFTPG